VKTFFADLISSPKRYLHIQAEYGKQAFLLLELHFMEKVRQTSVCETLLSRAMILRAKEQPLQGHRR